MRDKLIALFFITCFYSNINAVRYYVNAGAVGNKNGLSWSNGFTDLQSALSVVVFGDEIWVASGQYKPTTSSSRTISFVLRDGVNIYGGFAGNETSITQRDIASNPTTLSGDIGQTGNNSDNSHNIIKGNNLTSNITIDGFRIINSNSGIGYNGGGLKLTGSPNGNLILKNCYFYSNKAAYYGGAIFLENSKLTIEDCEFRNNQTTSDGNGGAIYVDNTSGSSSLVMKGSKFIGNISRIGACLANVAPYQDLIIDRCLFTNNVSQNNIISIDTFHKVKIYNSYFIGNSVNEFDAELLYVNHYSNENSEDFEMTNCTIANNYNTYSNSISGEIIELDKPYYKVRNCIIYGNTTYAGRQMTSGHSVSNCLIQNGYDGGFAIIDSDPLFAHPNLATFSNFDASTYDYTLQNNSPGVNCGSNEFVNPIYNKDLNNSDRIQGTIVDLGCFESGVQLATNDIHYKSNIFFDNSNREIKFTDADNILNKNYKIVDESGRMIVKGIIDQMKIKTNLRPGIYFIDIEQQRSLKFIIN